LARFGNALLYMLNVDSFVIRTARRTSVRLICCGFATNILWPSDAYLKYKNNMLDYIEQCFGSPLTIHTIQFNYFIMITLCKPLIKKGTASDWW
jgi:hypothetical protein